MARTESLPLRFLVGSSSIYLSVPDEHRFAIEMPRSVNQMRTLAGEIAASQRSALEQLKGNHDLNVIAFNEIQSQLEGIDLTIRDGFDQIDATLSDGFEALERTVRHLERCLRAELVEIKWVLGQVDGKLAELVQLVKFPGATEANELVSDGIRALVTGNIDDAEYCFMKAIEAKRTNFSAHMNLGFILLHKKQAEDALRHFTKACSYAPPSPGEEVKILAMETLARAYFAARDFGAAVSTMSEALEQRRRQGGRTLYGEYRYATYCAQAGEHKRALEQIIALCREDARFWAIASLDPDNEPIREELLRNLGILARDEHIHASERFMTAESEFASVTRCATVLKALDLHPYNKALKEIVHCLEAQNYSESLRASALCDQVIVATEVLTELDASRRERETAKQGEKMPECFKVVDPDTGDQLLVTRDYRESEEVTRSSQREWSAQAVHSSIIKRIYELIGRQR